MNRIRDPECMRQKLISISPLKKFGKRGKMTPTHPPTKLWRAQNAMAGRYRARAQNKHSRLNLANEKPLEKQSRKIKTINEEESEEANCWLATTTMTMEKQTIRNHQQTNKCFACRSTTMHMATKENKNEGRRKNRRRATRNNNTTNERRALTSIPQMAADHWSLLRFPVPTLGSLPILQLAYLAPTPVV